LFVIDELLNLLQSRRAPEQVLVNRGIIFVLHNNNKWKVLGLQPKEARQDLIVYWTLIIGLYKQQLLVYERQSLEIA